MIYFSFKYILKSMGSNFGLAPLQNFIFIVLTFKWRSLYLNMENLKILFGQNIRTQKQFVIQLVMLKYLKNFTILSQKIPNTGISLYIFSNVMQSNGKYCTINVLKYDLFQNFDHNSINSNIYLPQCAVNFYLHSTEINDTFHKKYILN